jgi:hypothetical protein
VLKKSKFNSIFELSDLKVGVINEISLIYRGPSRGLNKHLREFIVDLNDKTSNCAIKTHDGYCILAGTFLSGDTDTLSSSTFTVKHDFSKKNHLITMDPDATVGKLVDQFAKDMGVSRKDFKFYAYNSSGEEIPRFQKKLRTCCFDGVIELRKEVKPAPVPRSPRKAGAKSPKSPRSPRSPVKKSTNGRKARSQSPRSPKYKPASRVTTIDMSRLIPGRATKKSNGYSVEEIKGFLKERGLKQTGKKDDMIARLRANM